MSFGLFILMNFVCSLVGAVIWVAAYRVYLVSEQILPEKYSIREWLKNVLEASIEDGPGLFVGYAFLTLASLMLSLIAGPLVLLIAIVYAVGVWLTKTMTK